jgi:4-hydroxybenzoate polyprenyltransferase
MRSAGCIINDLWDRKIDQFVERTKNRPLVTGLVSIKEALIYLIFLLFLSLLILFTLPPLAIKISLFSLPLVILYPLMKRITFFPQLFLGITYNIGLIIGYVTVSNSINLKSFIAYFGFVFWTLIYDTIYGFLDIEDDKKIGVKSLAILLENKDYKFYFYLFGFVFLFASTISELLIRPGYYIFLNMIAISLLIYLIYSLDIKSKASTICTFNNSTLIGLAIVGAQFFYFF